MKLEIKEISSMEIKDIENLEKELPKDYFFLICVDIGEVNKNGADFFEVSICNSGGLSNFIKKQINELGFYSSGLVPFILIEDVNYSKLIININLVLDYLENNEDNFETWERKGIELSHYFNWEYERETLEKLNKKCF